MFNENFPLAIHYIIAKKYNKTLEVMDAHPAPGFVWHDIYVGTALDGLGMKLKLKNTLRELNKFSAQII